MQWTRWLASLPRGRMPVSPVYRILCRGPLAAAISVPACGCSAPPRHVFCRPLSHTASAPSVSPVVILSGELDAPTKPLHPQPVQLLFESEVGDIFGEEEQEVRARAEATAEDVALREQQAREEKERHQSMQEHQDSLRLSMMPFDADSELAQMPPPAGQAQQRLPVLPSAGKGQELEKDSVQLQQQQQQADEEVEQEKERSGQELAPSAPAAETGASPSGEKKDLKTQLWSEFDFSMPALPVKNIVGNPPRGMPEGFVQVMETDAADAEPHPKLVYMPPCPSFPADYSVLIGHRQRLPTRYREQAIYSRMRATCEYIGRILCDDALAEKMSRITKTARIIEHDSDEHIWTDQITRYWYARVLLPDDHTLFYVRSFGTTDEPEYVRRMQGRLALEPGMNEPFQNDLVAMREFSILEIDFETTPERGFLYGPVAYRFCQGSRQPEHVQVEITLDYVKDALFPNFPRNDRRYDAAYLLFLIRLCFPDRATAFLHERGPWPFSPDFEPSTTVEDPDRPTQIFVELGAEDLVKGVPEEPPLWWVRETD